MNISTISQKEVIKKLQIKLKRKLLQVYSASKINKPQRSDSFFTSNFSFQHSSSFLNIDFPILINGKVGADSERADSSYWSPSLLAATARETGYSLNEFQYVDGDQGMWSSKRREAGLAKGKSDAQDIWNRMKLNRNKLGQVTEKLQILTHSRGTVFGAAYMESLADEVKALAKKEGINFAYNSDSIIEYSVNLGPHQSNSLNYPNSSAININVSHYKDILSGNDAKGDVINIHSDALDDSSDKILEHGNGTFTGELEGILKILENSNSSKLNQLIDMYREIERTTNKNSRIETGSGWWVK
ncbi:hypothetical protein [Maribacter luteus]|uniref:Uncharacterized protein n=1 Tax=Maribacter luteus TaxID=2594478 RepID=A0A6I2MR38_9FLAO|nr:hypothetical protein [Maribacter luteus]MRX64900.1 hypothetical protein [Maribacter luteus]